MPNDYYYKWFTWGELEEPNWFVIGISKAFCGFELFGFGFFLYERVNRMDEM